MRFVCWITKATDTHSEYVIPTAFPRQQWLRERALILRYTYIACLVTLHVSSFLTLRSRHKAIGRIKFAAQKG